MENDGMKKLFYSKILKDLHNDGYLNTRERFTKNLNFNGYPTSKEGLYGLYLSNKLKKRRTKSYLTEVEKMDEKEEKEKMYTVFGKPKKLFDFSFQKNLGTGSLGKNLEVAKKEITKNSVEKREVGDGWDFGGSSESVQPTSLSSPEVKKLNSKQTYVQKFVSNHKGSVKCCAYNENGTLVVTGSADCSIKILSVKRMKSNLMLKKEIDVIPSSEGSSSNSNNNNNPAYGRPVIKAIYDHTQAVNCVKIIDDKRKSFSIVDFFNDSNSMMGKKKRRELPIEYRSPIIVSGSSDNTIRFYSLEDRRSIFRISEKSDVLSLDVHPSMEWLVYTTDDYYVRFYDLRKEKCFISMKNTHLDKLNDVKFNLGAGGMGAKLFLTSSKDKKVKLWNFNTKNKLIKEYSLPDHHVPGKLKFLDSGLSNKFVVCSNRSVSYMFDYFSNNYVTKYDPFFKRKDSLFLTKNNFSSDGQYLIKNNEEHNLSVSRDFKYLFVPICNFVCVYDVLTSELVRIINVDDNNLDVTNLRPPASIDRFVRAIDCSPTEDYFVCGGDDQKVRFFHKLK